MTSDNQGHNSVTRNQCGLPRASQREKVHTVEITLCGQCSTSVPVEGIRTLSEFCGISAIRSFEAHTNADEAVPAEVRLTIGIDVRDRIQRSLQWHSDFDRFIARVTIDDGRVHWCDRDLLGVILDVARHAESFWETAWFANCELEEPAETLIRTMEAIAPDGSRFALHEFFKEECNEDDTYCENWLSDIPLLCADPTKQGLADFLTLRTEAGTRQLAPDFNGAALLGVVAK